MIPVTRPTIRRRDMDSVLTCLVSDSLGPGELGRRLVSEVGEYLGLKNGIALRSRRRALQIALDALDLPPKSKIVMSPLVPWFYDAVVQQCGYEPKYVDPEPDNGCISAESVAAAIRSVSDQQGGDSRRPAVAVIVDTPLGFVGDPMAIAETEVPVIEDLSCGLGAHTGERKCGTIGRYALLSMEPDAIITSGGGALVFGTGRREQSAIRAAEGNLGREELLPDMNAALGLTQTKQIEAFVNRRREIAGVYSRAVMRGRHRIPVQHGEAENVYYSFPVLLESGLSEVAAYARKKGVDTAVAFADSVLAGMEERAEEEPTEAVGDFPNARGLLLRCLLFPLFPSLVGRDVAAVERVLSTLP